MSIRSVDGGGLTTDGSGGATIVEAGISTGTGDAGVPDGAGAWDSPAHDGPAALGGVAYFAALAPVNDLAVGPDGNLWLAEEVQYLERLTTHGVFTQIRLPQSDVGRTIALGSDGSLWIPDRSGFIYRLSPQGAFSTFGGTLDFASAFDLTLGLDGNIWLGVGPRVGAIPPTGGIIGFMLPDTVGDLLALTLGPDGSLWFCATPDLDKDVGPGNFTNVFGRISYSGEATVVVTLVSDAWVSRLTAGPDGNLWFGEEGINSLFRMTITGEVTEFPLPSTGNTPYHLATGPDGNLWFTKNNAPTSAGGSIGRITMAGEVADLPLGNVTPKKIVIGSDGNLWFTTGVNIIGDNTIGRLTPGTGG
jgi:streptogramin lyase